MTRRRATLRSAVVATLALALCACGDAERALRAEGEVTGSVDEPTAVAVAGWPDAETSFCSARVGFGRSQPAGARSTISATTDGGRTWLPRARLDVGAATLTCLSRSEAILSAYPPLNAARPE